MIESKVSVKLGTIGTSLINKWKCPVLKIKTAAPVLTSKKSKSMVAVISGCGCKFSNRANHCHAWSIPYGC